MKSLREMAAQFGGSKPVFNATINDNGDTVQFEIKDKYRPVLDSRADPVAKILSHHFHERLEGKRFVQHVDIQRAYRDIMKSLIGFYEDQAPLKNPKQSVLYKWLCSMVYREDHPALEGFLGLYRYVHSKTCVGDDANNIIAILELMKEKYEVN